MAHDENDKIKALKSIPVWMEARLEQAEAKIKNEYTEMLLIYPELVMSLLCIEAEKDEDHTPEAHHTQEHTCIKCNQVKDCDDLFTIGAVKQVDVIIFNSVLVIHCAICHDCGAGLDLVEE